MHQNSIPLNTKQAARALGVKPSTLEVWRCRGDGPTYLKIGRAVRYRLEDLEAFLQAARRENTSQATG